MKNARIYIYSGEGASFHKLHQVLASGHFRPENVKLVTAENILTGCLETTPPDIFFMPGGRDVPYTQALNGQGNVQIRQYVEHGGCYFGICAGAYYACSTLAWAKGVTDAQGNSHEISDARELGFFPGAAIGPVNAFLQQSGDFFSGYYRTVDLWVKRQGLSQSLGHYKTNYNGGPYFEGIEDNDQITTLGYYHPNGERRRAILECLVGRGKAILCSPHVEHIQTARDRLPETEYQRRVLEDSKQSKRHELLSYLLERALTPRQPARLRLQRSAGTRLAALAKPFRP